MMDCKEKYSDHINMWQNELRDWMPDNIFDAHVHIGRQEDLLSDFSSERLKLALSSYSHMDYDSIRYWHEKLYSGKKVRGSFVFPFPIYEMNFEKANDYIVRIIKSDSAAKGFLWTDPLDIKKNVKIFRMAEKEGVRFFGVKPYYDLLRKDNFKTKMSEILPAKLLDFINSENLVIMLHTTGKGVCEESVRNYIKRVTDRHKNIRIILAHMGRFLCHRDFEEFMKSDLPDNPAVFLDTSSAAMKEVYMTAFSNRKLWGKILFGSDIPFGLITGTEFWSETAGAIFRTRDKYTWSETNSYGHNNLTYNAYHVIKALKDAMDSLKLNKEEKNILKNNIFLNNALGIVKK
jgi:predicted TIM-barrel fold metal-dependent hydrolase